MATDHVGFRPVNYESLNARQKEIFNFQKVAATLADYGFNCIKLADDWQGADFLAYHADGTETRKVQLKSRLTIHRKYHGKDIWMAFPHDGAWYVIKHDDLEVKIEQHTHRLDSKSWKEEGIFHSASINPDLLASLAENKLVPVYGPVPPDNGGVIGTKG